MSNIVTENAESALRAYQENQQPEMEEQLLEQLSIFVNGFIVLVGRPDNKLAREGSSLLLSEEKNEAAIEAKLNKIDFLVRAAPLVPFEQCLREVFIGVSEEIYSSEVAKERPRALEEGKLLSIYAYLTSGGDVSDEILKMLPDTAGKDSYLADTIIYKAIAKFSQLRAALPVSPQGVRLDVDKTFRKCLEDTIAASRADMIGLIGR